MQVVRWILAVLLVTAAVVACGSTEDEADELTFSKTIEPLVQEKCQRCHREGGIAPFALVTYRDVQRVGNLAKEKVVARDMPPWGAFDDESCKVQHDFRDNLSLTQEQIDLFAKWVEHGMPEGDTSQRPPPKTFPADGLADKTHTFSMAAPYEIQGGAKDDIRCFPIDPGFTEDTWVGASNVLPGDPRVVHHVIVYVDPKGEGATKAGAAGNYPCFGGPDISQPSLLLAWAPGVPPTTYGEEAGIKVEKGSKLIAQVHYHPHPTTTTDQTRFELKVLGYKPGYVAQVILAGNAEDPNGEILKLLPGPDDPATGPEFMIPGNAKAHTESMELTIPTKVGDVDIPQLSVYSIGAHMHWAGVDMKIEVERANPGAQPAKECLLGTPKYDFNWQRGYSFDGPMDKLPTVGPGDKIKFTCTYDNTPGNRHVSQAMHELNMSSPPDIRLGETTLDEMCLGALVVVRRASLLD
jgi:hypothetical protein